MAFPYDCGSPADFLTLELSRRKQRNESYSLRAFARDLDLSPSRLSEILSGVHGVSEKTADKIATRLKLKPMHRKFWKDLNLAQSARSEKIRNMAVARVAEMRKTESFKEMQESQFRVISDWYHAAILELTQVKGFESNTAWIAGRLGIAKAHAEQAIERLIELGLLKKNEEGQWESNLEAYSAFSDMPSTAIRKFHRQILTLHLESLIEDPMTDREHLSMIMAVPKSKLPEFRQEMKSFMTQFWQKIEDEEKDDLYSLSVQLCPVRKRRG